MAVDALDKGRTIRSAADVFEVEAEDEALLETDFWY